MFAATKRSPKLFTIQSNASLTRYPENKPNNFKVYFATPLELTGGQWLVGLNEILFPTEFKPHIDTKLREKLASITVDAQYRLERPPDERLWDATVPHASWAKYRRRRDLNSANEPENADIVSQIERNSDLQVVNVIQSDPPTDDPISVFDSENIDILSGQPLDDLISLLDSENIELQNNPPPVSANLPLGHFSNSKNQNKAKNDSAKIKEEYNKAMRQFMKLNLVHIDHLEILRRIREMPGDVSRIVNKYADEDRERRLKRLGQIGAYPIEILRTYVLKKLSNIPGLIRSEISRRIEEWPLTIDSILLCIKEEIHESKSALFVSPSSENKYNLNNDYLMSISRDELITYVYDLLKQYRVVKIDRHFVEKKFGDNPRDVKAIQTFLDEMIG